MRIRSILAGNIFVLLSLFSFSQSYTHIYYMDESFNSVEKTKAFFICKGYQDKDNFKLDCFTGKTNILVLSAGFTDSSIGILHGLYQQFYSDSVIQSKGYYHHNQKQGVWQDWNEDGLKTDSAFYEKGEKVRYARYSYLGNYNYNNNGIYSYSYNDSLANDIYSFFYSDSGTVSGEIRTIGDRYIFTSFDEKGKTTDTLITKPEIEPAFPGGNIGWTTYLEKSLGGFNPMDHGALNGKWQVLVRFIVDTDGTISNIRPETNFGHKMEETVVRMLKNGPKWKPAIHKGKPVRAFRLQPVTFIVEEN
jgi:Gram-negative bacterial TonB protein C-terminal